MTPTQGVIRRIEGDEAAEVFHRLPAYAFGSTPPLSEREPALARIRAREKVVYYAAYEGEQALACACYRPLTQNVRGRLLPMAGVYDVATDPAARRKGYARGLMTALFAAMREQRYPLTNLYPFRESFYERLGYTTFPQLRLARLLPANMGPLLRVPVDGQVELSLMSENLPAYLEFMAALRARVHGLALFDQPEPAPRPQNDRWLALACAGGQVVGLMVYSLVSERPTVLHLNVRRFYALDARGRYLLLDWLARHVDQAVDVEMVLPAFETPETWMADLKAEVQTHGIPPMGRVLDVSGLNGLPVGPGQVTVRLSDPYCPWNAGVWRLESRGGELSVQPGERPDCELSIQALSALVYGTHSPDDFVFRGWGDPSPETQCALRSIFPPMQPYLHEDF